MRGSSPAALNLICFLIILVVAGTDQVTKFLITESFDLNTSYSVIASFFHLTLVHNKGIAFGMLSGMENPWRMILVSLTSVIAGLTLVYFFLKQHLNQALTRIAVALIVGGAFGNTMDRIRFGYVIDFFDFHLGAFHWPTFNVADSCITSGVSLLILQMFFETRREHAP